MIFKILINVPISLSVYSSLCGKLPSSLPTIFIDSLKVTPVAFLVSDFDFSSRELDDFIFVLLCFVVSY